MTMQTFDRPVAQDFSPSRALETLQSVHRLWSDRYRSRHELTSWTQRYANDVGLSLHDIAMEAKKPFWKA